MTTLCQQLRLAIGLSLVLGSGGPAQDVAPPTTLIPREGCVTAECHPGTKAAPFLHGPIRVNACDSCHVLADVEAHRYDLARPEAELCQFCHTLDIPDDSHLHAPLKDGECLPCHDPHGGSGPSILRGAHYDDLCMSCHEDVTGARALVHGPASAGTCGACHEPHASPNHKLLATEGRDMCLRCHVTVGIEIDNRRIVHEPMNDDCQICHDPHATDNPALLIDDPATLCLSCHEDVAHTIDTADTQHAAVATQRACLNCHDAHASDHPAMLANDVTSLCFECHDKTITLDDGTELANMKEIISSGTSLHGAISERNCVACHEIHGGGHSRLLKNEYRNVLYFPYRDNAYALCFSCHDKQMVTEPQTTVLTAFRNGDANLHFEHVNRDKKGRTCSICHDSHAASRDRHIRDEIPFGPAGWMLPIGFEIFPDGGRCSAGCHAALEYNRVNPVVYSSKDENEGWKGEDLVPGVRSEPP